MKNIYIYRPTAIRIHGNANLSLACFNIGNKKALLININHINHEQPIKLDIGKTKKVKIKKDKKIITWFKKTWDFIKKISAPLLLALTTLFVIRKQKIKEQVKEEKEIIKKQEKIVKEQEKEVEKIEETLEKEIEKSKEAIEDLSQKQEQRKEDISEFLPGIKK